MEQQHRHVPGFPLERSLREIDRLVQVINAIGSLSKGFEDKRRIRMILLKEVAEIASGIREIALLSAKHGVFEQVTRSFAFETFERFQVLHGIGEAAGAACGPRRQKVKFSPPWPEANACRQVLLRFVEVKAGVRLLGGLEMVVEGKRVAARAEHEDRRQA